MWHETCDGTSVTCPTDLFEPLGMKCVGLSGDVGSCYSGICENRHTECQRKRAITEDILPPTRVPRIMRIYQVTARRLSILSKIRTARKTCGALRQTRSLRACLVSVILLEHDHDKAKRLPVLDCWFRRYVYKNMLRGGVYFNGFACGYRAISSTTFAVPAGEATGSAVAATVTTTCCGSAVATAVSSSTIAFPAAVAIAAAFPAAVAVTATKSTSERAWRLNPSPPPMPPAAPTTEEVKTYPPPANLNGDDVTTTGIVNHLTVFVTISGYAPDDFNIANRNAFIEGLSTYLGLAAGTSGVTFVGVTSGATRRRLMATSTESVVQVTLLLTASDSVGTVLSALDTGVASKAQSMQRKLAESLPKLDTVSVTSVTASTEDVVADYAPKNDVDENVEMFGEDLIAGAIAGVLFLPSSFSFSA